ncbi:nitrate reductase molybdenum cofactor assembly chaperone [Paludibacterium purpuratum]|uniref:Respiratory nitrate reductase chaperone NarJ n=1 Tax=Paludibacterium purpuratum TaxID=1144873 RepID=A0A4V3DV78_9NEIS|nr:nitrate reductase molybdenum cofactor assembly chaperone [Paludibacterium purpuratum]TDR79699.1 respiratory nitrate reductase chaperone NarJ [Paludibacterium purpuratum]
MNAFSLVSVLLQYPEADLLAALPEIRAALAAEPENLGARLAPLLEYLQENGLIELQTRYVDQFDRNRSLSLHLFEHVYGESRERGEAMVSLMGTYHEHGFFINADELPDFLPLMLEFLGQLPAAEASALLGEAVHVIAAIGERLAAAQSPYAVAFAALVALSPVEPLPVGQPPVRDMDEAMERFGSGLDGMEPLLTPQATTQTIRFHPRPARQGA